MFSTISPVTGGSASWPWKVTLNDRRSWPSCQAATAAQSKKLIIAIR